MNDSPNFYLSEHPLEDWWSPAEYADEVGTRRELVIAACKVGLLPAWQPPTSNRWRIPPEAVDEQLWGWTERRLRASPKAISHYCATVFDMDHGDRRQLETMLAARPTNDPMAQVVRWMMRGMVVARQSVPPAMKRRIFERDAGRCTYCRKPAKQPEYDHVLPVSWGGAGTDDNIVLACRACNRAKRDQIGLHCRTCGRLTFEFRDCRNRCGCTAILGAA